MLVLFFASGSFAVVPVVIPVAYWVASAVINAGILGVGVYATLKDGGKTTVSPSADAKRPVDVAWVDLTLPVPAVVETSVNASMTKEKMMQLAQDDVKYPLLHEKLTENGVTALTPSVQIGDVVDIPTLGYRKITGKNFYPAGSAGSLSVPESWYGTTRVSTTNVGLYGGPKPPTNSPDVTTLNYGNFVTLPTPRPVTPSEFAESVTDPITNISLSPYQLELDKMFQDPNYIPAFTDSSTGLPVAPPLNAATPAQVDSYNKNVIAKNAAAAAIESGAAAVSSAQGALTTAQDNLASNPTDSGLIQAVANASAALGASQSQLDALKAQQAKDESNEAVVAGVAPAAYGDDTVRNFDDRFRSFIDTMKTSSLFSMPGQLLGNIPAGGQSTFDVDMGRFGHTTFDLASYGQSINVIKTLILIIFSITGFRIVTLKGGSG